MKNTLQQTLGYGVNVSSTVGKLLQYSQQGLLQGAAPSKHLQAEPASKNGCPLGSQCAASTAHHANIANRQQNATHTHPAKSAVCTSGTPSWKRSSAA
jgi:hypothetical protein